MNPIFCPTTEEWGASLAGVLLRALGFWRQPALGRFSCSTVLTLLKWIFRELEMFCFHPCAFLQLLVIVVDNRKFCSEPGSHYFFLLWDLFSLWHGTVLYLFIRNIKLCFTVANKETGMHHPAEMDLILALFLHHQLVEIYLEYNQWLNPNQISNCKTNALLSNEAIKYEYIKITPSYKTPDVLYLLWKKIIYVSSSFLHVEQTFFTLFLLLSSWFCSISLLLCLAL